VTKNRPIQGHICANWSFHLLIDFLKNIYSFNTHHNPINPGIKTELQHHYPKISPINLILS
jgi:hypothetical protein